MHLARICMISAVGLALATPARGAGPTTTTPFAWYRADVGVALAGGADNTAISWQDHSGHGRHLAAAGNPRLTHNGPNGLASVTFDGDGDYFQGSVETWRTAAPGTVVAAWKWTGDPGAAGVSYVYDGGTTDRGRQALARSSGGMTGITVGALDPANNIVAFAFPDPNAWVVSTVTHVGDDTIRLNGVQVASGNLRSNPGMEGILVGGYVLTPRNCWKGEIFELLVYEGRLSEAERDQVERYLLQRLQTPAPLQEGTVRGALSLGTNPPSGSIDIGTRMELFVDDHLIERMTGTSLVMHPPRIREIAIVHDQPWEGNNCGYHTVFQDGDRYRMYYMCSQLKERATDPDPHASMAAYAESTDGINWQKPVLGLFEFNGSKQNNLIWAGLGSEGFSPFKDPNPACAPDAPYKALGPGSGGLVAFKSLDGIRFSQMRVTPVITQGAFDSQNLAFWDSVRGEYRAYWRDFRNGVRDIKTATSKDFLTWTEPAWLTYPNAPVEHLYTNQIAPYYRAPHIFLGFPTRYTDRGWTDSLMFLPELEERQARAEMSQRYGTAITDGLIMSSRDGLTFSRWGEAFIPPERQEMGRWMYGDNYQNWGIIETRTDIPRVPKELSVYAIEGCWRGTANRLRRYTLRIDGFVSVQAKLSGGELLTKPLVFRGNRMVINYATSAAGSIRVELQDEAGAPISGYGLADCPEIFGDTLERVVRWNGNEKVGPLGGRPLRLRCAFRKF